MSDINVEAIFEAGVVGGRGRLPHPRQARRQGRHGPDQRRRVRAAAAQGQGGPPGIRRRGARGHGRSPCGWSGPGGAWSASRRSTSDVIDLLRPKLPERHRRRPAPRRLSGRRRVHPGLRRAGPGDSARRHPAGRRRGGDERRDGDERRPGGRSAGHREVPDRSPAPWPSRSRCGCPWASRWPSASPRPAGRPCRTPTTWSAA